MSVDCRAEFQSESGYLSAHEIRAWIADLPDGAVLEAITRDTGTQRDPEVHLVGLRATWSEQR